MAKTALTTAGKIQQVKKISRGWYSEGQGGQLVWHDLGLKRDMVI